MNNSSKTFAEQGVKESISLGFYAYEDSKNEYSSVNEWAEEYAESLWENRSELDEERDNEGDVTLSDYKEWSIEKATELIDE